MFAAWLAKNSKSSLVTARQRDRTAAGARTLAWSSVSSSRPP
jgi:hypothetical protein